MSRTLKTLVVCAGISCLCAAQPTITTIAGRESKFEGDGGPAVQAKIGLPTSVALDGKGNVFFTDEAFSLVLKVDAGGRLTVVARAPQVNRPRGIAVDAAGAVYVVDSEGIELDPFHPFDRIRKIAGDGSISTVAGSGSDSEDEDIPAIQARLIGCGGLALDADGNLYVAESGLSRVRRVTPDGKIRTFAGRGGFGFGFPSDDIGDGGPATEATLFEPSDVAIEKDGGLLIADTSNYRIRRVGRDGFIRTVAGGGRGFRLDENTATEMSLDGPHGIATAPDGSFYLSDWYVITRVTPDGKAAMVTTRFGSPEIAEGRQASEAYIASVAGMAVDSSGRLYLADARNSRVRRIEADGALNTVAGSAPFRFGGDGSPATDALLNAPTATAVSPDGSVHFLDRDNCRVRSVTPDGVIRTIAGNGVCLSVVDPRRSDQSEDATKIGLGGATAIAADSHGNVYLADGPRIRIVTLDGQIKSVVNRNSRPGFGDASGPALDAPIGAPIFGLYVDGSDNIYIADLPGNRVRKVSPDGAIRTFAGSGPAPGPGGFSGDGGPAVSAQLRQPTAITGDAEGNIYILDAGNQRIRKVGLDGIISTFSPFGPSGFAAGVAVDGDGKLYFADPGNQRIRQIGVDGIITTIAGTGDPGFDGDGGLPTEARLNSPAGVAFDAAGNLYVADSGNHRIRRISGK